MNLEQLRKRVRRVSGFNMVDLYPDDDLELLINEVYVDVCGAEDWPFLYVDADVTVDATTVDVGFPIRFVSGFTYTDADRGRLRQTTVDELDLLPDDEREGRPEVYAHVGDSRLIVWPPPDKAYQAKLRGYRDVVPLEQDADAPIFEPEFHPVIVYETASRLLVETGDFDRVEGLRGQAADGISRMRVRYLSSKDRAMVQMGGRAVQPRRWRL